MESCHVCDAVVIDQTKTNVKLDYFEKDGTKYRIYIEVCAVGETGIPLLRLNICHNCIKNIIQERSALWK